LNKELYKKHPLIQFVLMEIAKKTRESASSFAQKAGIDPAISKKEAKTFKINVKSFEK